MVQTRNAYNQELVKVATSLGNGSHVILPKDWEGYEVKLSRVENIDPKRDILKMLAPYLSDIIGVYLYGSYARKEQGPNSDIDVIVISDKKLGFIEFTKPFDVTIIEKSNLNRFKKANPVLFYSFLLESNPIFNSSFLADLRDKELKDFKKYFRSYIADTSRTIEINNKLLNLNKEDNTLNADKNLIYSLILRLRGIYIIDSLLREEKFSNEGFLKILKKKIAHQDPNVYYDLYRAVRDNKRPKNSVSLKEAEDLIILLTDLLNEVSSKLKNAK